MGVADARVLHDEIGDGQGALNGATGTAQNVLQEPLVAHHVREAALEGSERFRVELLARDEEHLLELARRAIDERLFAVTALGHALFDEYLGPAQSVSHLVGEAARHLFGDLLAFQLNDSFLCLPELARALDDLALELEIVRRLKRNRTEDLLDRGQEVTVQARLLVLGRWIVRLRPPGAADDDDVLVARVGGAGETSHQPPERSLSLEIRALGDHERSGAADFADHGFEELPVGGRQFVNGVAGQHRFGSGGSRNIEPELLHERPQKRALRLGNRGSVRESNHELLRALNPAKVVLVDLPERYELAFAQGQQLELLEQRGRNIAVGHAVALGTRIRAVGRAHCDHHLLYS